MDCDKQSCGGCCAPSEYYENTETSTIEKLLDARLQIATMRAKATTQLYAFKKLEKKNQELEDALDNIEDRAQKENEIIEEKCFVYNLQWEAQFEKRRANEHAKEIKELKLRLAEMRSMRDGLIDSICDIREALLFDKEEEEG